MFKFEKLDMWQKPIDFADVVYSKTKSFPSDERFGLTNQMRRAAVSISSNISLFEVVSESTVAKRQGYLSNESFAGIYESAEQQGRMLSGLGRTLVGN